MTHPMRQIRNRKTLKQFCKKDGQLFCDPDNRCAIFPAVSTVTRIKEMNAEPSRRDGYMRELDGDYNAIRWMQANIKGSPVIETSEDDAATLCLPRLFKHGDPAVIDGQGMRGSGEETRRSENEDRRRQPDLFNGQ